VTNEIISMIPELQIISHTRSFYSSFFYENAFLILNFYPHKEEKEEEEEEAENEKKSK
jgi:hypothetical protein